MKYHRIEQYGLVIHSDKPGEPGIPSHEFLRKLPAEKKEQFSNLFGIQTVGANGAYPWDVEAVLERMESGKRTGT